MGAREAQSPNSPVSSLPKNCSSSETCTGVSGGEVHRGKLLMAVTCLIALVRNALAVARGKQNPVSPKQRSY